MTKKWSQRLLLMCVRERERERGGGGGGERYIDRERGWERESGIAEREKGRE